MNGRNLHLQFGTLKASMKYSDRKKGGSPSQKGEADRRRWVADFRLPPLWLFLLTLLSAFGQTSTAAPTVSYALTTTTDSVAPGKTVQFKVTIANLTTSSQAVSFSYHEPNFADYGSYPAGTYFTYNFGAITAGASKSVNLSFTILSATQTPPKDSLSTLVVSDNARGASVSRSVTVNP